MISKLKKHQESIPYVMVCRKTIQLLNNPNALAIWVYLQSKPDDWTVRKTDIKKHFSLGDISYSKAINQLKDAGIYRIKKIRDKAGLIVGNEIRINHASNINKDLTEVVENPYVGETRTLDNPECREISTLKENRSIKEEEKRTIKENIAVNDCFGYQLNADEVALFNEYLSLRKSKKMITTDSVKKRLLKKYFKFGRNQAVIENAITGNWKDFYELRGGKNEGSFRNNQCSENQRFEQSNREILDRANRLEREAEFEKNGGGLPETLDITQHALPAAKIQ